MLLQLLIFYVVEIGMILLIMNILNAPNDQMTLNANDQMTLNADDLMTLNADDQMTLNANDQMTLNAR
jgi:uncharacterized protein (DUF2345 family)